MRTDTYYAHPKCFYGSLMEARDMIHIDTCFGSRISNPSDPYTEPNWKVHGMKWFDMHYLPRIKRLVFRRYPDGEIGSGVAYEINAAIKEGVPVYEIHENPMQGLTLTIPAQKYVKGLSKKDTSKLNQRYRRRV